MVDHVKNALSRYAEFGGRSRRAEYWSFFLFNIILSAVAAVVDSVIGIPLLAAVVFLGLIVPGLAVAIRRMHDTGRSGWFLLVGLIPIVGAFVVIYFLVQDSQPEANQYGPNPKGAPGFA